MANRKINRFVEAGTTERGLRSRTKTKVQRVRRILEQLAIEWEDLHSAYVAEVEGLYFLLHDLEGKTLEECIEDLKRPAEDGW